MLKEKRVLVFDTETQDAQHPLIYDIGWTVTNKRGEILGTRRALIREVICNAHVMRKAFYHSKIFTLYLDMIQAAREVAILMSWPQMVRLLRSDMDRFKVDILSAYNLPFDVRAMRTTARFLQQGHSLTRPVDRLCLWNWACKDLFSRPTYHMKAKENGWITKAGNVQTTAEHGYRYITNNASYIEPHTALEDSLIETAIYHRLVRAKKAIPYNVMNPHPWRLAQK